MAQGASAAPGHAIDGALAVRAVDEVRAAAQAGVRARGQQLAEDELVDSEARIDDPVQHQRVTPRLDLVVARPACGALPGLRESSGLHGPDFTEEPDEVIGFRLEHQPVHQPTEEEARQERARDDDEDDRARVPERVEDEGQKHAEQDREQGPHLQTL